MKKLALILILGMAMVAFTTSAQAQPFPTNLVNDVYDSSSDSTPTPNDDNDNLLGVPNPADINDAINLLLGTNYANNEDVDFLQYSGDDSLWLQNQVSSPIALISLTAGNQNTVGIYKPSDPVGSQVPILGPNSGFGFKGNNTMANPFPAAVLPNLGSSSFGWYLNTVGSSINDTWYSQPGLNVQGFDVVGLEHFLTYRLSALNGKKIWVDVGGDIKQVVLDSVYLHAWEDQRLRVNGVLGDEDYDDSIYLVAYVQPVPEPASMMLLGSGLLGMVGFRRKKRS